MGAEISINTSTTDEPTWTLIGEPTDINGPSVSQEFADFTHMQSPSGFREQKPTFKSSGTMTFNVHYVKGDTGQTALKDAANANPTPLKDFKLVLTNGAAITFSAYPGYALTTPMANAVDLAITLTVSGTVEIDEGE
jgi:hypothetical protein